MREKEYKLIMKNKREKKNQHHYLDELEMQEDIKFSNRRKEELDPVIEDEDEYEYIEVEDDGAFEYIEVEDGEELDYLNYEYEVPVQPIKTKKKKSFMSRLFTNIVLLLCFIIFAVSAYQLYMIYNGYKQGDDANQEIQSMALITTDDPNAYWKYYIDFDKLYEINEEVVGWVRFDDPSVINYAILKGETNESYLFTTISGDTSIFGSIFMDIRNPADFTDKNTIIYGHNMKNGSMFGSLNRYKNYEQFEEFPNFYIYTPDGMASKYKVAAVKEVRYDSWHYDTKFTEETYQEYIDNILAGALYNTNTPITLEDNIVTLSTCTASDTVRLVVQGIKVEEHEMENPEDLLNSIESEESNPVD